LNYSNYAFGRFDEAKSGGKGVGIVGPDDNGSNLSVCIQYSHFEGVFKINIITTE